MYKALRPLFFQMDPERAHHRALGMLALLGATSPGRAVLRRIGGKVADDPCELFGLRFRNRIGLAAGYDKDAEAILGLAALGFGHVEIGTVTPKPQAGNPKPRVFRLAQDESLINRMGFPSAGAEIVAARLEALARPDDLVLGVNIGKQKSTPIEAANEDYLSLFERFAPLADYITVNVSSPNTPQLRELELGDGLSRLLDALATHRRGGPDLPILIKISPDLSDGDMLDTADRVLASGMDGLIVSNTTVSRDSLRASQAKEGGGLSGAALTARSQRRMLSLAEHTKGKLPLIGVGGLFDASTVRERKRAGASLVQLFTGLIFRGPGLIGEATEAMRPSGP